MNFWRGTFIGLVCLVAGLGIICQARPAQTQNAAPVKGRPALYEFGSKYCIPCKEMKEVMAALQASHGNQVEFRMIYVDEEKPMFGEYKIVAIPTQVFLDTSGKEVDRHLGALSKEEVLKKLKELNFVR